MSVERGNPAVGGADFQNIHRAGRDGQEGGVAFVDESGNSWPENVGRWYAVGWTKALAGLGVGEGPVLDISSGLGSLLFPTLHVDCRHQTRWDGLNGVACGLSAFGSAGGKGGHSRLANLTGAKGPPFLIYD